MLTCININNRFAIVIPIKTKSANEIGKAV
jgi:hypothetical protein